MEQKNEERNAEMGNVIVRSEEFIKNNEKPILIAVIAVLVIILAIFGLRRWYFQPREERAQAEMFGAEQWFDQGEFQKALDGDDTFRGFPSVISSFGGTKAANLARYYAGVCNLQLGNYDDAIHYMKKYKGTDTFSKAMAEMVIGDAQIEQGNTAAAAASYKKAAKMEDNFVTTPTALFKAGMAYLMLNDNKQALECFKQVKNYPESTEYAEIDRYIAIAESGK